MGAIFHEGEEYAGVMLPRVTWEANGILGAKNLLRNTGASGGIFTVNADGSVKANGTGASGGTQFSFDFYGTEILSGKFLFSGCPAGGALDKYDVYIWDLSTGSRPKKWDGVTSCDSDIGQGNCEVLLVNGHSYRFYIRIRENVTVSNLLFYPMIRLGEDIDGTFYPYAETNRELTIVKRKAIKVTSQHWNKIFSVIRSTHGYNYLCIHFYVKLGYKGWFDCYACIRDVDTGFQESNSKLSIFGGWVDSALVTVYMYLEDSNTVSFAILTNGANTSHEYKIIDISSENNVMSIGNGLVLYDFVDIGTTAPTSWGTRSIHL